MLKLNGILNAAWLCFVALTSRQVLGQTPEIRDQLIPVIAAVNRGGPEQSALIRSWRSFRSHWPQRPFCLLRLEGASELFIPGAFAEDSKTIIANIARDGNEVFMRSDWYDACNLDAARVRSVALLLDIEMFAIQSSFEWFLHRLMFASDTPFDAPLLVDPQANGNWIDPLDVQLLASSMPSSSPTRAPSVMPTPAPSPTPSESPTGLASAPPSGTPSGSPTKTPTKAPSGAPSGKPSGSPSDAPSKSPSAGPSAISGTDVSVGFALNMTFPTTNSIITSGMSTTELATFDTALETYLNTYLGSVLSGSEFIGTSALNTYTSETRYTAEGITTYSSTVTATFRSSSVTASDFATAANTLSPVPLVFEIFSIGGNFAEVLSANFEQTYSSTITPSPSTTPSATPSISLIPSVSSSPSQRPSLSPSASLSPSQSPSQNPSDTPSGCPSLAPSVSKSPSQVPSQSPSISNGPSQSPSQAPSISTSPSQVPSQAPSVSKNPSQFPSQSPSISTSPSQLPSVAA